MRFIGDIHGDVTGAYNRALRGCEESVQVGDFGRGWLHGELKALVDEFHENHPTHRFIRGNHDDPQDCETAPGWIKDGSYDATREIMYVGGAWSIDAEYRTPGRNWWPDEELSVEAFDRIIEDFGRFRPKVMVTHDCPRSVATPLFFRPPFDTRNQFRTRTSEALDVMLEVHQPDLWLFGHWHEPHDIRLGTTRFICVDQYTFVDIDL